ncbi:sulfatase family protein [Niabella sp. 22666]|uniref:sulfatase family protein n=1 Tax=Niabella sp. 22666 TaxID=3453954 RepID=UPI003F8331E8
MKMIRYTILLFLSASLCLKGNAQSGKDRPNIVFVIGDDISIDDIGAYGNTHIRTPHIDDLAARGLRFNNMYVTSSSCSPSRVSILTGRYPHNTGAAELHAPVPAHLTYFPELLKASGYYTALAGKWHEGPNTSRAYDTILADKAANGEGGESQWEQLYLNRPKNKPFFFWLAAYDAHRDWSADHLFQNPYKASEVRVPSTLNDDEATRRDLASYYNEISRLDESVGVLVRRLKEDGQLDNTIIVFIADNARPFPGSKTRVNDRGLKTPFIFSWPQKIRSAAVVDALVSSIDIAPTFLHLAGVQPAATIQGTDFTRLLKDPKAAFRNFIFGEHNWHDYEAYERSVRSKNFLYIFNGRPGFDNGGPIDANQSPAAYSLRNLKSSGSLTPLQADVFINPRPIEELYDLKTDSAQLINIASDLSYRKHLDQYRKILARWQKETGDTQPVQLTADWYDRKTGEALPQKGVRGEMPGASKHADRINVKSLF